MRLWRHADIHRGALVEPPKQLGAAKWPAFLICATPGCHIKRFRLNELIRLLPEAYFTRVAEKPPVADDAMHLRRLPGEHRRLRGASDGRRDFAERTLP